MKIEYKMGNLLSHQGKYIVHGCNMQGKMGAGVAKEIKIKYPRCYEQYLHAVRSGELTLGSVVPVDCGTYVIFNAITQMYYGTNNIMYLDELSLVQSLQTCQELIVSVHANIEQTNPFYWKPNSTTFSSHIAKMQIAMPMIGSGHGGGDWAVIHQIIEEVFTEVQPVVYILGEHQFNKISEHYS
jgi:O-acetyl-ADP-ribose deacetylase (regulator of RNase III)